MLDIYFYGLIWATNKYKTLNAKYNFTNRQIIFLPSDYRIVQAMKFFEESAGLVDKQTLLFLLKGMLEGGGKITVPSSNEDAIILSIPVHNSVAEKTISLFGGNTFKEHIIWEGYAAIDLIAQLHDLECETLDSYQKLYDKALTYAVLEGGEIKVQRVKPNAVLPFKKRATDVGYDLTLVEKLSEEGDSFLYDTGLRVEPPQGWYFDLVPRSSLTQSGFILANSIGIIDPTYRGNLRVALLKVEKGKPALALPGRYVQLVPRRIQHFKVREVTHLDQTARSEGGFGSTGK